MPASRTPRFARWQNAPGLTPPDWSDLRAPNAWLLLLEGRAPWEYAALLAATLAVRDPERDRPYSANGLAQCYDEVAARFDWANEG